jgi:hypothetical protein
MNVTVADYFELVGVLLVIYGIFRVITWPDFCLPRDFKQRTSAKTSNEPGHPIDTSKLTPRLESVRRDYAAEARAPSPVKPLLVEERRAEIAKLAFFQKPPAEPEPPEHERGLVLLTL